MTITTGRGKAALIRGTVLWIEGDVTVAGRGSRNIINVGRPVFGSPRIIQRGRGRITVGRMGERNGGGL